MKKIFFIFGAIISTLSACFAELIPGASHVLNFTNKEVEALQRLLYFRSPDRYEHRLSSMIDPNILKKYPPHNIKNSEEGFSNYEIQNKENILNAIEWLIGLDPYDLANFSGEYHYIAYLILVTMLEKVELPAYCSNDFYIEQGIYYLITISLLITIDRNHQILTHAEIFPEFRKNANLLNAANRIFVTPEKPTLEKKSEKEPSNCIIL